jgi:fructose-bisphosphate aldolase, class II
MKYLTMAQILEPCVGQNWAVGAYDTCNLEITRAIVEASAADQAPAILMIYPHHTAQAEWPALVRIIEWEAMQAGIPAALVLDHAKTLDQIKAALDLGFSGVMIDGSLLPLDENISITRQAVELAHGYGASVEAELGHVGQGDDEISGEPSARHLTRVDDAARFIAETGVDALAVSIGTLHGLYRGTPHLDFERIAQLRAACPIPLVLHGGSDTPDPDIRRAIETGIDKINIWTDVRIPFLREMKRALEGPLERTEVKDVYAAAQSAAVAVIRQKNQLLGSAGKASFYRAD